MDTSLYGQEYADRGRDWTMHLSKNEIIKDGENLFSVFVVLGSVVYAKRVFDVNSSPTYELEEVLKHYRKIEIMEK